MRNEQSLTRRMRSALMTGMILLVSSVGMGLSGCHSSDSSTDVPKPSPSVLVANNEASIAAIQSNPNIPPATKERIITQLQGKFQPSKAPQAPTR